MGFCLAVSVLFEVGHAAKRLVWVCAVGICDRTLFVFTSITFVHAGTSWASTRLLSTRCVCWAFFLSLGVTSFWKSTLLRRCRIIYRVVILPTVAKCITRSLRENHRPPPFTLRPSSSSRLRPVCPFVLQFCHSRDACPVTLQRKVRDFVGSLIPSWPRFCFREVESQLEEAVRRADTEQERASAAEAEVSRLREEMKQAEHGWRRFVSFFLRALARG